MGKREQDKNLKNEVFVEVVKESLDRLYATALRLSRNPADAEDLVQETLLRGLRAWSRLDPSGNLAGYLFRTMVNLFINQHRHANIVRMTMDKARIGLLDGCAYSAEGVRVWSDPPTRFVHSNLSSPMKAALDGLSHDFRTVLILADVLQWSYAEIADHLQIPAGTVMSRLFRARRALRARLEVDMGREKETEIAVGD